MSYYDPNLVVPPEVVKAVQTIREFAAKHSTGNSWQIGGLGPVSTLQRQLDAVTATGERVLDAAEELKRQLDEVTRERDQYKAVCVLADALRNLERGL